MDPRICHALAAAFWLLSALALVAARPRLNETTLLPALLWGVAAFLALTLLNVALALGDHQASWVGHATYCAGVATFCPLMAVLGARRPQHRAWQLIVLSLLVTATLPAVVAWLYSSQPLEMHVAWRWLLLLPLVGISFGNSVPTRYWVSGLAGGIAQVLLLEGQLPLLGQVVASVGTPATRMLLAATLALIACVLWWLDWPRRRELPNSFDCLWLDFRDTFGAVWGLRIAERLNATAAMCDWQVWVSWQGLRTPEDADEGGLPPETEAGLHQATRNLLRRFVDEAWIARRWDAP